MQSSALLTAALEYVSLGWAVIPTHDVLAGTCSCGQACSSPGKHPRTAHGLKDATTDPNTVRSYWERWPTANVAVVTGSISGGLVVVDVDVKKGAQGRATIKWFLDQYPTFAQTRIVATPSGGYHYYFRGDARTGAGVLGEGVDIRGEGGYVLAPPSIVFSSYDEAKQPVLGSQRAYSCLSPLPLQPYPIQSRAFTLGEKAGLLFSDEERGGVPHGEHRAAVVRYCWTLRRVFGLSVEAALPLVQQFCETALIDYNPRDPFTERDIRKMLEAEPAHVADALAQPVNDYTTIDATEVVYRPVRWLLDGFVAKGELTLLYGDSGLGKSSFFSWLAAHVSSLGMTFGYIGVEEGFDRFAARAHVQGADRARLFGYAHRPSITLNDTSVIKAFIRERSLDVLYFDSVKSHFHQSRVGNAATDARGNLDPLAEIAGETGCTIVATFHTNKEGDYSGSTELRAVSRTFLEAKALGETQFTVRVDKSNFQKPDYKLVFERSSVEMRHHKTGEQLYEEVFTPTGSIKRPATLPFLIRRENVPVKSFNLGEKVGSKYDDEIREILTTEPNLSANKVIERLGLAKDAKLLDAVRRVKAELA